MGGVANFAYCLLCAVKIGGPVISLAVWEAPRETFLLFAAVLAEDESRQGMDLALLSHVWLTQVITTYPALS